MQLFDLTKIIFERPGDYSEVAHGEKRKNFFMVNRRFSIMYPMQAHVLNHIKINQGDAVDVWQRFLSKIYNKTPFWMFTKGVKKAKEDREKKINVSMQVIEEFARKNQIDARSVIDALEFFPKKMQKELKDFEKLTK